MKVKDFVEEMRKNRVPIRMHYSHNETQLSSHGDYEVLAYMVSGGRIADNRTVKSWVLVYRKNKNCIRIFSVINGYRVEVKEAYLYMKSFRSHIYTPKENMDTIKDFCLAGDI